MRNQRPDWQIALLCAAVPALLVVGWDQLEGAMPEIAALGIPPLFLLIGLFILLWPAMIPVLKLARSPATAGLMAGGIVALVMLVVVIGIALQWGWFVMMAWVLFAALAVGLGAAMGGLADGTVKVGRVAFVMGAVLIVAGLPFFPGFGAVVLLLVGVGLIALGRYADYRVKATN